MIDRSWGALGLSTRTEATGQDLNCKNSRGLRRVGKVWSERQGEGALPAGSSGWQQLGLAGHWDCQAELGSLGLPAPAVESALPQPVGENVMRITAPPPRPRIHSLGESPSPLIPPLALTCFLESHLAALH